MMKTFLYPTYLFGSGQTTYNALVYEVHGHLVCDFYVLNKKTKVYLREKYNQHCVLDRPVILNGMDLET